MIHVQHAVRPPTEAVQHVVRVFGAEAGEDDAALIGFAVAIGVGQVYEVGAVGDVNAAIARFQAGWDEQAVRENGHFVGAAGTLGIFEDNDLVVGLLAWLDLRVSLAASDPEPAASVEVHLDRLGQQRIGREKVDLEAVGDLKGLPFQLRVGVRHRGVALSTSRTNWPEDRNETHEENQPRSHALRGNAVPRRSASRERRGGRVRCKQKRRRAAGQCVPTRSVGTSRKCEHGCQFYWRGCVFLAAIHCAGTSSYSCGIGTRSLAISFSSFSTSGSNLGISTAFWPCSYLRKPNRYVSFCGRQRWK